jgi:hypothetical protein
MCEKCCKLLLENSIIHSLRNSLENLKKSMNQKDDRYFFFYTYFSFIFIDDVLSISEIFVFLSIFYLSFNRDKESIINF